MKLRDLYEAAEEADTNEKSRKLYNEILVLCPDEVDAKRELIALELHPSFQIYQLKQLVESLKKPKKIDWNIIETRPYMRCLIDMGMIYLDIICIMMRLPALRQFFTETSKIIRDFLCI